MGQVWFDGMASGIKKCIISWYLVILFILYRIESATSIEGPRKQAH